MPRCWRFISRAGRMRRSASSSSSKSGPWDSGSSRWMSGSASSDSRRSLAHPRRSPDPRRCDVSMGIYLFTRAALEEALTADAKRTDSTHDFGRDVIPWMFTRFKVMAYNFSAIPASPSLFPSRRGGGSLPATSLAGQAGAAGEQDEQRRASAYWRDIGTLDAYYEANMDLMHVSPQFNLYDRAWPILTYHEQWPPVKTVFADDATGRVGMVLDSLVANGCVISGGRLLRCVLSPDVRINSFAEVTDSILMEHVEVGYNLEEDRRRFHITEGEVVVVGKGTVIEEPRPAVSLVGT